MKTGFCFILIFDSCALTCKLITANIISSSLVNFENRENIIIEKVATDDNRSYQINSDKIFKVLGYKPSRTLEDAVYDLCNAFKSGKLPNSLSDDKYMNVRVMKNKNVL